MVGGTMFHRRVIQREISRVLVLNLSGKTSGAKNTDRIFLSLTPPSLLSRGTLCRLSARSKTSRVVSEDEFQAQLDLAGGEGGVGLQEILCGLLVVGRVGNSVNGCAVIGERSRFGSQAVGGNSDARVEVVEEVEGIGGEVEPVALADMDFTNEAEVCGSVVGPGEGVAAVAGKTIVVVVAILVGIAGDR